MEGFSNKKLIGFLKKSFICFLLFQIYFPINTFANTGGTIIVEVTNTRNNKGSINLGLYKSVRKQFDDKIKAVKMIVVKVTGKKTVCKIEDIDPGHYSIAILHDEDEDGKTKFNFMGIPREGIGFSTNPRILTSSPYINDCSFEVVEGQKTKQTIKVKYLL